MEELNGTGSRQVFSGKDVGVAKCVVGYRGLITVRCRVYLKLGEGTVLWCYMCIL